MVRVKTINKMDLMAVLAEDGTQIQQSQRFYPEIVSGEIVDPRIDQKNLFAHRRTSSTIFERLQKT